MSTKAAKATKTPKPTSKKKATKDTVAKDNVEEINPTSESSAKEEVPDGHVDLRNIPASEFVASFEGHVEQLTNVVWDAVLKANKEGVFVNRNVAASAFAEVTLRVCVAQAKSIEGGVDRFKQILDL